MRPSRRAPDELRPITLERGVVKYAEGSCMVKFGDTHVLVTATLEDRLPPWLKGQGRGWVTAEYGMLPRATHERMRRESAAGKQSGRTVEIQRLIGRSLRTTVDLVALGERQITVDCDVIQADGGTRTASRMASLPFSMVNSTCISSRRRVRHRRVISTRTSKIPGCASSREGPRGSRPR